MSMNFWDGNFGIGTIGFVTDPDIVGDSVWNMERYTSKDTSAFLVGDQPWKDTSAYRRSQRQTFLWSKFMPFLLCIYSGLIFLSKKQACDLFLALS